MIRVTLRLFAIVFVQTFVIASLAEAQGLSQAVLVVSSTFDGTRRNVDGRLYGGAIEATISDRDDDRENFSDVDRIRLTIRPRSGQGEALQFPGGTRSEFEDWARENATALLGILFPDSLSSSVLGRGAGELQAQEVLLATAFATESVREMSQGGRSTSGGM